MGIKVRSRIKRFGEMLNGVRGWIPQDIEVICDKCSSREKGWSYLGFTFKGWYGIGTSEKYLLLCPNCIKKKQLEVYPKQLSILKIELVKTYDNGKQLISLKSKVSTLKE